MQPHPPPTDKPVPTAEEPDLRTPPPVSSVCVFCGQPGRRTKEHIIAQWVSEAIDRKLEGYGRGYTRTVPFAARQSSRRLNDIYLGPCGDCNSGWMSRAEDHVRGYLPAMLFSDMVLLSPNRQAGLSLWAAKTAAVGTLRYLPTVGLEAVACDARRSLASGQVPRGWTVRLGRASAPLTDEPGRLSASVYSIEAHYGVVTNDESGDVETRVFATTFRLWHLVLQVIGYSDEPSPFVIASPPLFPKLNTIWPTVSSFAWPIWPLAETELEAVMGVLPRQGTHTDAGIPI